MNTIARRIAAGATLAIAPVIIALGTATAGHAATSPVTSPANDGPTSSTHSEQTQRWTPSTPGTPEHFLHPNRGHHYVR